MAVIYVSYCESEKGGNIEKAKKIIHDLQVNDTENCYICPLTAFSHLANKELDFDTKMALRLDLLSNSDILMIASDIDEKMNEEIEFACLVGMEVQYIENA